MTQPSEPRTAAGRALLRESMTMNSQAMGGRLMPAAILAIEAEAAAPDPVASPPDHDCLMPSACGVTGFYCSNATRPAVASPAPLDRYGGLIAAMDNAVAHGLTVHVATRAGCAAHLLHGDDKATEPLTAAAFGLNVERLARALDVLSEDGDEYALMAPEDREYRYEAAQRLAAAYAAEGQPVAEEGAR